MLTHKKKQPLISVVILSYKQEQYLKGAIDSVLNQDYPGIEMIIADDSTPNFKSEVWSRYINDNKRSNIVNSFVVKNEENRGTVKNINSAISRCRGEYVMFFAGDDELAGKKVLSVLAEKMALLQGKDICVSGLAIKMDHGLVRNDGFFQNGIIRSRLAIGAKKAHRMLLYECCYSMGATMFIKKELERINGFDESYKVIEDWSFFLSYSRSGGRVFFADYPVLKHRDGGISEKKKLPLRYTEDLKKIYLREVFPYINEEKDSSRKIKILLHYKTIFGWDFNFIKMCLCNPVSVIIYLILKIQE